jgi:hypothetical protein
MLREGERDATPQPDQFPDCRLRPAGTAGSLGLRPTCQLEVEPVGHWGQRLEPIPCAWARPMCSQCRRGGMCRHAVGATAPPQDRERQVAAGPVRPALRKSVQRPPARPRGPVAAVAAGAPSVVPRSCQATAHQKRESSSRLSASAAAAHCKAARRAASP